MGLNDLSYGSEDFGKLNVIVEICTGSNNKYEYDKDAGVFRLDRVLYSAVHYPTEYGYINQTLGDDGDPLDAMVVTSWPTFPGCVIEARPVGVLYMIDGGDKDEKILCVPTKDPRFAQVHDIDGIKPHMLKEIEHFFQIYKDLENKKVDTKGWGNVAEAKQVIQDCVKRYRQG
ncbi:MAG: inorganic diphosphatase [Nitrospirota bacterium]|nr:inorganic diphosphatase [Nitrospirota bacterium]